MTGAQPFIDYYNILRVDPGCDAKTLELAYHELLKIYHPDHAPTADTAKFNQLIQAYRVLRNADRRAEFDLLYAQYNPERVVSSANGEVLFDGQTALDDADDHARMLMFLYNKRRENAQSPGVVGFYLQDMLNCSDEQFEFHKWYLKEKGFIVITEQGTLAITVQGIDHVISTSRTARAEKLLIAQSRTAED
jgi:curved DNA-binding protein